MPLQSGLVYEIASNQARIRVLRVDPERDIAALIPCGRDLARLTTTSLRRLQHEFDINALIPVLTFEAPDPDAFVSEKKTAYRKRMMEVIRPIVSRDILELAVEGYWPEIVAAAKNAGLSVNCVYGAVTRYLQNGCTEAGLTPRWSLRGRSSTGSFTRGLALDVRNKIAKGAEDYYRGDKTWDEAHKNFLQRDFCSHIEINARGEEVRRTLPADKCPSLWQFYRIGRKHLKTVGRTIQKIGRRAYELTSRGKPGSQAASALYPGMVAEIDWTISDVIAVRKGNRTSIGRLVVYAIVDRFSGEILSIYLTMFSGSWEEAAKCILLCLEDKVELCARADVPIKPEDWPVKHLFWRLVSDKGEVDSWKATPIATGLGIEIEHTVGRRPDQKGTIEAVMKMINYLLYRRIPGATTGMRQRCTDDPRVTAAYDFDQLNTILHAFVIWRNKRLRKRQPLTPGMVADGILDVPNQVWTWADLHGLLRCFDLDEARAQLAPWRQAKLTEYGFALEELNYVVPDVDPSEPGGVDANEWLAKARKKRWSINLAIELSTIGYVYFRPQLPGKKPCLIKCPLAPVHAGLNALSWEDWRERQARQTALRKEYKTGPLLRATQNFRATFETVNAEAIARTKAAREGLSKAEQARDVGANRAAEIAQRAERPLAIAGNRQPLRTLRPYFDEELWPTTTQQCDSESA